MSDSSTPTSPIIGDNFCKLCDPKKKYFNCICGESWNTFEEHLNQLKQISPELIRKQVTISTMTLCVNFNSHIDLDTLADLYTESVNYSPNSKKTKDKGKKDCFYNSLLMNMTTRYQDPAKISVKFFPNGKLQIAGCKTIMACCYAIRKAYNRILKNGCFLEEPKITDSKIVMINTDFKIVNCINQEALAEILSEKTIDKNYNFLQVVYQSSKYPGINAKFIPDDKILDYSKFHLEHGIKKKYPDIISILIFRPGSVIVTGGNKIFDYISAVNSIIDIITKNKNEVLI